MTSVGVKICIRFWEVLKNEALCATIFGCHVKSGIWPQKPSHSLTGGGWVGCMSVRGGHISGGAGITHLWDVAHLWGGGLVHGVFSSLLGWCVERSVSLTKACVQALAPFYNGNKQRWRKEPKQVKPDNWKKIQCHLPRRNFPQLHTKSCFLHAEKCTGLSSDQKSRHSGTMDKRARMLFCGKFSLLGSVCRYLVRGWKHLVPLPRARMLGSSLLLVHSLVFLVVSKKKKKTKNWPESETWHEEK